jgi:acyl-CoA reductase-like NAD-dependent aldehyde dehydrogenase
MGSPALRGSSSSRLQRSKRRRRIQSVTVRDVLDKASGEVIAQVVRASADSNLKRLSLELGGKAPSIIARDADIDAAVAGCLQGSLLNSGQVCAAYTRLFVDRRRVDEFTHKLAAAAGSLKLGPGLDTETVIGPLVSSEHLDQVDRLVGTGVADGAELVTGGARADGSLSAGYFYRPTVSGGVTDDMTIAREEIFGPVLSVLPYDTQPFADLLRDALACPLFDGGNVGVRRPYLQALFAMPGYDPLAAADNRPQPS